MKSDKYHEPVLLRKVIEYLNPQTGKSFIDATIGGGGHTEALLARGARVLGIDRDEEAIEHIKKETGNWKMSKTLSQTLSEVEGSEVEEQTGNLTLTLGNFANIYEIAKANGFDRVDGIIFDLGVSSHQLETAQRGFSFTKEGPLDMRMDKSISIRAYDLINNFEERRLNEIFKTFGQEKFSRRIAGAVCSARQIRPIESTTELARIIEEAIPRGVSRRNINIATKVFQAIRIVVNSELLNLEEALPQTVEILKSQGRLAIISFHSLEDAIVKRFLKKETRLITLTKKPIGPDPSEIEKNPKSRSAKLRVAEKI